MIWSSCQGQDRMIRVTRMSQDDPDMPSPPSGKRARNKADKAQRIRAAAYALFVEKGYDSTTLRDVAAQAEIGFGTIFDYTSSKRDLLFMLFNPLVIQALEDGCEAAARQGPFLARLMALFECYYRLYQREPALSRDALRELNFFSDSREAQRFLDHRAEFLARLTGLITDASSAGHLATDSPPALLAQLVLSVFAWEVRRWLSGPILDVEDGVDRLRMLLAALITGFQPRDGVF